ncbi:MAG: DUF1972 domain-containing protein [Deltaproteobacteria bacterium]|nr:DUF1972 domain-containing protein [Deltaproteobacteria bacterium]
MRIALCGTRGIPACYGGFETFAEQVSERLVKRGHEVTVYGRKHVIKYDQSTYKGAKIRLIPAPKSKYLETPIHTLLSLIDVVLRRQTDVVLVCNAANSAFLWLPRLFGIPVAVNVDGIERLRAKWNSLGKLWYRIGEQCSVWFASAVISDAQVIADYYQENYNSSSTVIPYGCDRSCDKFVDDKLNDLYSGISENAAFSVYEKLGIKPNEYLLYLSRLEPENNAHVVIEAYNRLPERMKNYPLIIVGDAPYADQYKAKIRQMAGSGVSFVGAHFGAAYSALQIGARVYLQATEVGGTHPALVESMGYGNCIVANGTPEHYEVLADTGVFYNKNDAGHLCEQLRYLLEKSEEIKKFRKLAAARARSVYDWDVVTTAYEGLLQSICR